MITSVAIFKACNLRVGDKKLQFEASDEPDKFNKHGTLESFVF